MLTDKPSKPVKFGVIGCGAIAWRYMDVFENLKFATVIAVADIDLKKTVPWSKKIKCQAFADYRNLLENKNIDAVIIATPSGLHAQIAIEALHAGKHVVVEKPMAMTLEQADAMIEAAKRANLILGTMLNKRYLPACVFLRRIVEQGRLGRLLSGSVSLYWYRPQEYYDESGWRGTISMDGGVLMNQAIHHLDLLLWYMGNVKKVHAYRATLGHNMEAEDTAVAILEFEDNALGTINASTCAYPKNMEETLTIIGEKGSVILGGSDLNGFRVWHMSGAATQSAFNAMHKLHIPKWYGHYKAIEAVCLAIIDGKEDAIKNLDGKPALELVHKIYSGSTIMKPEIGRKESME
ncbi:MAG TPA: oxidoreductase [Pelotomaculum sp.]|nr:oxidoreductase [Pelotomaculum sp.]